ncbi:MAG: type II secretion system F family protein [Hyphomonas sp.]|uniref:type II secretion system F family protein n=1 Tax=Hyphomonas sp. TaxID=87 RepID=UPI0030011572
MMQFRYNAVDSTGKACSGTLTAGTLVEARQVLRSKALLPVQITLASGKASAAGRKRPTRTFRSAITSKTLTLITRQLASLIANSIRIEEALAAVARQDLPARAKTVLTEIRHQIIDGSSLAKALSAQGNVFPRQYISSVAAGESSGRLDIVLEHLAEYTETRQENRQTLQLALIYPAFLALVSGAVIVLLLTKVVPDVVSVYQRRGADLPLSTDLLIAVSNFLRQFGLGILAALTLLYVALAWAVRRPAGRQAWGRWSLKAPLFGPFNLRRQAAEISGTLAILIQSGVPLVEALKTAAGVASNDYVSSRMHLAANDVGEGTALDLALSRTGVMPPMMLAIVASAIRSGELGPALARTARDQQKELGAQTKALVALMEPMVLLVMGGIVLFIVLAILTPIVNLNTLSGV